MTESQAMRGGGTTREEGDRSYPGWRVVLVCFVLAVFSWAFGFYGQSVYVAQLSALHGWPVATVASAATIYYLTSAVLVAFAGDALARIGPRRVIGLGILFLAAGVAATGQARTLPQAYGAYMLLACGWAATSIAAITSAIGTWFEAKRGLAISLALNGASAGGVLGAPMLVWASDHLGFAAALALGGGIMLAVVGPLLLFAWPADLPPARAETGPVATGSAMRGRALRLPAFWTMSLAFAAGLFVQVGFIVHLVTMITPIAGSRAAGIAVSATAVAAVVGRLALGTVVDRLDPRAAGAGSLAIQVVALLIVAAAGTYPLLLAGCILFGLSVGNLITLPALIVHREFDAAAFGTVISLSTAIGQVVYAFGPGALGWLRDASGGYGLALVICAAIDLGAAALVLAGRRRRAAV
ncbi:MFS transporter [Enterovirga rhinocerotis]|uniref:Cyanate permease n=1 Tax=Enterovirga rhinocerotis TaxID=1339210 RepID=A0A4R7CAV5_9HYPH|nr:MFS transporter [Enterovirga rhinocerotis]TDR94525.1 cyanate permease [Enterovirga rhinocerotis]